MNNRSKKTRELIAEQIKQAESAAFEKAANMVVDEGEKWKGAAYLYALEENKLARQMKAACVSLAQRIRDLSVDACWQGE